MLHSHTWWKSSPLFSDLENCVASGHAAAKASRVFHLTEKKPLDSCKMLHFAPLQCIPTQQLPYQLRSKVILAQSQCLAVAQEQTKLQEKLLASLSSLPSVCTQGLSRYYLWSQQKKSWTRSATFQLHGKHPFHLLLTIFILLQSFAAPRPCKGMPGVILMTKLLYDFMTQSYGRISWQSNGHSIQCGHLSPSRGSSWHLLLLRRP